MKTPDIDTDLPALIPESIADSITTDPAQAVRLCNRARMHWKTNAGFRKSFKRHDEREQLAVWMRHWIASEGQAPHCRRCLDLNPKTHD